jgi:hypothetical protein
VGVGSSSVSSKRGGASCNLDGMVLGSVSGDYGGVAGNVTGEANGRDAPLLTLHELCDTPQQQHTTALPPAPRPLTPGSPPRA